MRDARITQRSLVLSQHHGLVFRGTVTTYTDTTHFKVSSFPAYGNAADFPDDFFKDYNAYVVWDSAGGGSAPQGETQAITGYTSADGTFTNDAFTTPLEAGDEILLIHPSLGTASIIADLEEIKGSGFVQADDSLEAISTKIDEIEGTGFVSADDSLEAISTEISEIMDLVRSSGDIAVTSAETNLYIDDAPTKTNVGISIKIDTSNMVAGDTYEFREYYRMEAAGSWFEVANTVTLSGAQSEPLYVMGLEPYRYGMKITSIKTTGTDRSFKIEVVREV